MALLDSIEALLSENAQISSILTGGIYTRRLMAAGPDVYGSTPQAFSNAALGQVRPSLVLRNEARSPLAGREGVFAENHIIALWLYVPATIDGKAILQDVARRIRLALNGMHYTTEDGHRGTLSWSGQTGYRDAPEYTGTLVDTVRFVATALTRVPV